MHKLTIMEIWRDIKGYEGLYQVSNEGRVKALKKNVIGKGRNQYDDEHIIKQHKVVICGKERFQTTLFKNGVRKYPTTARLVYETFIGEIPDGMQVNHIDEDPSNNNIENLNIMTPKENSNWGTRNQRLSETFKKNGKRSKSVLQYKDDVLIAEYPSAREASRQLNVYQINISRCCNGGYFDKARKKWININQAYGFIWKYKNDQPN